MKLGHFAALRWTQGATELPEVFVAGEGLQRGGASVLATLLHEAVHGLAQVRGVADVSRDGRYHNRRYKVLAEEVGLTVSTTGSIGWSKTELPEANAKRYQCEIDRLGSALTLYRRAEIQPRKHMVLPPSAVCVLCPVTQPCRHNSLPMAKN